MHLKNKLILASNSPRRKELLLQTGIPFSIQVEETEEIKEGDPVFVVTENARLKGEKVANKNPDAFVLASDTVVAINNQVLFKPKDEQDAFRMLSLLQNNWHEVYTGVALFWEGKVKVTYDVTKVHFVPLTEDRILHYISTNEPMDKAGAYALQGIGGMYVDRVEGSFSNVIGLPMALVRTLLIEKGFEI